MSRLDPKPGRWILPLAVVGIIGFTGVFVNALPPAEEEVADDATAPANGPTSDDTTTTVAAISEATTTTTTIPPEIEDFLLFADTVSTTAQDLLTEAQDVNDSWDDRRNNFRSTLDAFREFARKTSGFAGGVAGTNVPDGLTELWDPVQTAAATMLSAADEMVTGLQASDTGQIRRAALGDFRAAVEELSVAIDAAVEAAI